MDYLMALQSVQEHFKEFYTYYIVGIVCAAPIIFFTRRLLGPPYPVHGRNRGLLRRDARRRVLSWLR